MSLIFSEIVSSITHMTLKSQVSRHHKNMLCKSGYFLIYFLFLCLFVAVNFKAFLNTFDIFDNVRLLISFANNSESFHG